MRLVPTILLALSCAGLLASAVAAAQTVSLTRGGKQVSITVGKDAVLPADFPADVFVMPGASLGRVDHAGPRLMLEFTVPEPPAGVAERYAAAMAAAGWTPATIQAEASARVLAWEKDRRAVLMVATPAGSGSTALRLQLRPRHGAGAATPPPPAP